MAKLRAAIIPFLAACSIVSGCGWQRPSAPPAPTRTALPDLIGLADHWESGDCSHVILTLQSGDVVDVDPGTRSIGCRSSSGATFLVGDARYAYYQADVQNRWIEAPTEKSPNGNPGPLVFAGSGDGAPWLGIVPHWSADCDWKIQLNAGEGAYLEPGGLHMANGLLLHLAADFTAPGYPEEPFPLRRDDSVCLNRNGEVESVEVWGPY